MAKTKETCVDNIEFRMALVAKIKSGDLTHELAMKQLRSVKRQANKNGEKTYYQLRRDERWENRFKK